MKGYCLDAGALIGLERGVASVVGLLDRAIELGLPLHLPAGVLAQVWRGGPRQAVLTRFLNGSGVQVIPLDGEAARAVGVLCGIAGTSDVVDAHVALHAHLEGLAVMTSDPQDLSAFGPLEIVTV
jgi:hypothetical protein